MGLVHRAFHCVVLPLVAVAALLLTPRAGAAARTFALHPLVVVGGEGNESSGYGKLLDHALARRAIHPAHPERVTAFLAQTPSGSCHDDPCLAALAKAAGADATLFVSISPYTPRLLVSARLISASSVQITSVAAREYVKGGQPLPRVVREALEDFVHDFPFDAPEPTPTPVATKPPDHPVAQNPVSPTQTSHPGSPGPHAPQLAPNPQVTPMVAAVQPTAPEMLTHPSLRLASYLTAGAGALALIGGATVALASRTDRAKLEQLQDGSGNIQPTPEAYALHDTLSSRSRLTNILLISGGAAVAAGATLFFLSRPTQAPQLSLAVTPTGAFAGMAGHF